jgi:type II secretion system protein D
MTVLSFLCAACVAAVIVQSPLEAQPANEPDVTIAVDKASNSLIILGSSRAVERVSALVRQIQDQIPSQPGTIRYITLPAGMDVNQLNNLLGQTLERISPRGGQAGDLRRRVATIADPAGNALIIAANDTDFETVADLIAVLSKPASTQFPIHTVTLRRADAAAVARALVQFFDDRAKLSGSGRGQQTAARRIAVAGIEATNTLLVSATDDDFAQVQQLVEQFDSGEVAAGITFRVFQLQHAKAPEIERTVQSLVDDMIWNQPGNFMFFWPPQPQTRSKDTVAVRADARLNALIVTGRGDKFDAIGEMIQMLDAPPPEGEQRIVRLYRVDRAPLQTVAEVVRETFNQGRQRRPWEPPDPNEIKIRADQVTRTLIVSATAREQDAIKTVIEGISRQLTDMTGGGAGAGQMIFIIDLQHVPPETAKGIIESIGLDKPQPADSVSRIVSEPIKISLLPGRNAVVILANPADRETVVGLLKAIDAEPMPQLAEVQTQVVKLKNAQAAALAQILVQVLNPGEQQAATALARAVREQVRRLSIKQQQAGTDGRSGEMLLDLTKPIRVVADPNLNAIVVSSTPQNVEAMEELIELFDQLPITDAATVQLFPLQNIAAEQFSRIVREIFAQGKQLGRTVITNVPGVPEGAVGKALLNTVAISIDERTNTVIVAGSEDAVALVDVLAKRLDADVIAGWVEPKVLPLRFADATDLAATLQSILVEGVTNLPQSSPIQRQIGRLRMARLKPNGDPDNVIESDVFSPMTRLVIRPMPQMNALVLVGTPANIAIVGELVAMLDIELASPSNAVRIYPIENASAARLAQTIRQLFDQQVQSRAIRQEDRVIVQADERTNALIVATSPRSYAVLEGLLKTLDSKLPPDLREIRTIEIKNASAARLANLIQQMMDARLERLRRVQPETADLERATVIADARTNSLLVAAGADSFEVIKRMAADLDVDTLGDAAGVHVIPMPPGSGNIDRTASAINQIMERRYADLPADVRRSQRPLVLTDSRSSSLLVTANPEDLASIQELVTKLSAAPPNPAVGIHVIGLPAGTSAELIGPRLQRLMNDRQASMGVTATPSDRVSIEAELGTNSLIVAASDENLQIIRGLIDTLVTPAVAGPETAGKEVEVVVLSPNNRAADIVDMLRDLYVQEANRTRGPNTIRVTADERLNAVIINAPGSDVRAIKNLIAQLEGARPATVLEIKYVPLKSANAVETVSLIENVLAGRGIGARRGTRQATVLKYLREIAKTSTGQTPVPPDQPQPHVEAGDIEPPVEMEVSAAIRESITLTPDLRTNTIIVTAPRESIAMIERMIRDLDDSSTGSKNIRIFKLVNADAIAMAEILSELFRLKQGNSMYVLKPREDQPMIGAPGVAPGGDGASPVNGGIALGGTELTAVPDERQQLSITVDSRTNSLIVSGTPTYLDLVAQVVEELDKLEANEREVFVYQLRNSVADEVARVIGEFVDQEQKKLVGTLSADQLGSAARLLEREITIQGDKQSNTVLVSASPRYMDRVKEMIRKLDVDPPQVLIQVMLAEVTLDSKDEWGVDLFASGNVGGTSVTGRFGLGTTFVPGLGVPNLAIASTDFELLIRAMKSQGRLQVLSNPSIMAANNAPARIQVGETIRLPVSTSVTDTGTTFSALEKEDLGVILKVTPSINPDGFVRMTVVPEISNLSTRTTQISETLQSPIITRRTADTTVTVHDGQTIVIGGLISDRFERRDRKVPFFGDLPFVGPLFRANTEETAKTELLIVLTPHVIESPTEFDRISHITEKEIDRLSVPQEVKESIRRSLIDGTGALYNSKGEKIEVELNEDGGTK